ncbi:UDP-2,3-diacylglucosamine diphosphatase [bacterium endosymbiont of Bathymodiolus sp. 5 South]|jgi:UDP-2,3-diacylglucosamine hydrolase|uniref:UDP-2,3-diacylglucosamine diphosphatase n=2 Tax=bacterium endosymbiont of Bathymodiolus sp. 5 South TaxID=1181670 RepID=UPI0010B29D59|nr:UDP-2,3-diacylglucosamine diphosphatase [bacterium endosymbiont of Bathymodiolus sp. 5 South]VVH58737.1 UDP-2,3-diacylglucosamine diphosphatase (EC [uncultured Gammaproteobacteria bacterium]SHN92134.1 UDP-2,3-diacylglucosamine diphosphatase [bacterium endosymbiont of Bathymodiolus sp. 5 South]SSC09204.1 UDP-2,3-diacylglucosamine diphosphatase [bacterium endosymbiont of Bathymodiolus sp. 5 South]VVH63117.1 UDP-2,3-diacylglucosamine diphosphatase (EC [uncultured Gammaproteobacteria bacterium]
MMRTLLIADLHLTSGEADKTNLFIKFCHKKAIEADQIFILGDLFDTWLGDDLSLDAYPSVISALKKLSKTTQVFIMGGNRDFLLGDEFAKQTNCVLFNTPYLLKTHSKNYVLIHGDELCTDDKQYQRLKSFLQHPVTQFIFLHLPTKTRLKLSGQLRKKSVAAQQYKSREIMDINQNTTDKLMQKYAGSDLIHGHTHRQNIHKNAQYTRYVLGDWHANKGNAIEISEQLNYLEIH